MVFLHIAEGFEEIEAVTVIDVLRRARVEAHFVSVTGKKEVTGTHGITITADFTMEEADYGACQMIILPGGMPGTTNLIATDFLICKIKEFVLEEKHIAAICAAPMVFAFAGVLEGKKATIYPGMEQKLEGAKYRKDPVVVDGKIITSKGPGTAIDFALTLVEILRGRAIAATLKKDLVY